MIERPRLPPAPTEVFADLPKPRHGAPCNRCGACCKAMLCDLGQHVFGREIGPCPALQREEIGYRCGLVAEPGRFSPGRDGLGAEAALLIGANWCCDAQEVGERRALGFDARLRRRRRETKEAVKVAAVLWGIPPWRLIDW